VSVFVSHLPPELKKKVRAALKSIAADPHRAKELRDELTGLRSYRVAGARLIYRIEGSRIEVVAFGPRADIYERAAGELSLALRRKKTD
jgi:mRNA-degrading endonuclease RelE of RelBE toxin-antitoxin system